MEKLRVGVRSLLISKGMFMNIWRPYHTLGIYTTGRVKLAWDFCYVRRARYQAYLFSALDKNGMLIYQNASQTKPSHRAIILRKALTILSFTYHLLQAKS